MKIEEKVKKTLKKIKLNKNEKIIVALSGGKDSSVTAYLLKKFGYNIEGFHINLRIGKYSEDCLEAVKRLCEDLKIKLHVYDMKDEMGSGMCYLRTSIQSSPGKGKLKNCAICGVIKKGKIGVGVHLKKGHTAEERSELYMSQVFDLIPYIKVACLLLAVGVGLVKVKCSGQGKE